MCRGENPGGEHEGRRKNPEKVSQRAFFAKRGGKTKTANRFATSNASNTSENSKTTT